MSNPSVFPSVQPTQLENAIRTALGSETFQLAGWQVRQLGGGAGNPVSVGLYRFSGNGLDRNQVTPWSVILKIIQSPANSGWTNMGEGADQTHWNYWKREWFVQRSGFLDGLPEGMVAPRSLASEELPGDIAWLWMEDIHDSREGTWDLDRYALTARHLGRLNGLNHSNPRLASHPWLGSNLVGQWSSQFLEATLSLPTEDPRVSTRYPRGNDFHRLLQQCSRFLAALHRLPRAICHGDTYPTNFMSRRGTDGLELTVALDWALLNLGPLGDDLGQFTYGALANLGDLPREKVIETLFAGYLLGLQDAGIRTDPAWVRFGFVTCAALRIGLFQAYLLGEELKRTGPASPQAGQAPSQPVPFEVEMASEAFSLLPFLEK